MRISNGSNGQGRVASIHLHPREPGAPLTSVESIELVEQQGIRGEPRYFGKRSFGGKPSSRQVSLIEREQIAEHAATLGLECISPGVVRSNIETTGIDLVPLIGRTLRVGGALLRITKPRDPCHKMDEICQGLRALMDHDRQGVLAQVLRSGPVQIGDAIEICNEAELESSRGRTTAV